jgi:hypothetical protein
MVACAAFESESQNVQKYACMNLPKNRLITKGLHAIALLCIVINGTLRPMTPQLRARLAWFDCAMANLETEF